MWPFKKKPKRRKRANATSVRPSKRLSLVVEFERLLHALSCEREDLRKAVEDHRKYLFENTRREYDNADELLIEENRRLRDDIDKAAQEIAKLVSGEVTLAGGRSKVQDGEL